MSRVTREDESQESSSLAPFDGGLPLAHRIEEMHLSNLQHIISLLGQMLRDHARVIEEEEIGSSPLTQFCTTKNSAAAA